MTYIINDNGIDRAATPEEVAAIKQREKEAAEESSAKVAAVQAAVAAKESARAKLKALGLTDAEIAALAG
jgi:hypothetical protein